MVDRSTPIETPSWDQVEYYLDRNQSVVYRLSHSPNREITYEVDGRAGTIELLVGLERSESCPPSPSPAVEVTEVAYRRSRAARIRSTIPEVIVDFHELVCALAARMIRHGVGVADAISETIRSWHRLIDGYRLLETSRVGVHGELLVLAAAGRTLGWRAAVASWVGPRGAVHDFSFGEYDLEVKATTSERRVHRIHGLEQLTPKAGRELWFSSVQSVRGGDSGRTLTQSAGECLARAHAESAALESELADLLQHVGLNEFDSAARDERWLLRSTPILLHGSVVPRLDQSMIPSEFRDRILNAAYDVDVTGMASAVNAPLDIESPEFP